MPGPKSSHGAVNLWRFSSQPVGFDVLLRDEDILSGIAAHGADGVMCCRLTLTWAEKGGERDPIGGAGRGNPSCLKFIELPSGYFT